MARRTDRKRVGAFFGLSALVHLHIVLLIIAGMSLKPEGCTAPDPSFAPIEVALVPADTPAKPEVKPEDLEEEEKKEEEKEKDSPGQVVDLPPPAEERRPEKARFRSEYDSKVAKETKAPPRPFKPGKIVADRPLPQRQSKSPPPNPKQQRRIERKVMKLAMRTQPDVPRSKLEPREDGKEAPKAPDLKAPKGPKVVKESRQGGPKRISMKDLKLSQSELAKAVGTRVNDALQDVQEGKQTLLNSKRWRFASFFNRVKRQVAQNWHPDRVYRRRDPQGNVYGFRDRLTIVRVRLTPAGKLKNLHVEKASGVGFLDDEAISAFRAAEPFPNPPKGLVDRDTGEISFRFGFLFEISRRPTFRLFRFRN